MEQHCLHTVRRMNAASRQEQEGSMPTQEFSFGPPQTLDVDGGLSLNSSIPGMISPIRTRVSTIEYFPASSSGSLLSGPSAAGHHRGSSTNNGASYGINPTLFNDEHNNNNNDNKSEKEATKGADNQHHQHLLVAVRYFLDRPGYGLHNSAVRLWFDPPVVCTAADLIFFLEDQGIALTDLLVEVYLDMFQSFMLLEACEAAAIEWNLQDTTVQNPGIFNIRLTDVSYAQRLDQDVSKGVSTHGGAPAPAQQPPSAQHANTTPVGLFAFSIMVGLEAAAVMAKLWNDDENFINASYALAWGPYMFFCGGFLLCLTGLLQVFRNNIYGAVAFLGFGSFWFANGARVILETHFSGTGTVAADIIAGESSDSWGKFIRASYVLAFSLALLKQTLVMNKLSTTLIALLTAKVLFQALAGWSDVLAWIQVCFGWLTSWFSFYVFVVELTNQVYHREVFCTYKWSSQNSPEEVFGAAGASQTLYSRAARLRQARYPNVSRVRSAMAVHSDANPHTDEKKTA